MSDEPNANADREEWADRVVDRGLREMVGGEKPPEMSERILAAAGAAIGVVTVNDQRQPLTQSERAGFNWGTLAIAASLLVGAAYLLLTPSIQSARDSARRTQPIAEPGLANPFDAKPASSRVRKSDVTDPQRAKLLQKQLEELAADAEADVLASAPVPTNSPRGGTPSSGRQGLSAQASNRQVSESLVQNSQNQSGEDGAADPFAPAAPAPGAVADYDYMLDLMPEQAPPSTPAPSQLAGNGVQRFWRNRGEGRGLSEAEQQVEVIELRARLRLGVEPTGVNDLGAGPGAGGDQYLPIVENPFQAINSVTTDNRLSTFSIDVDTASYANVRQFLMQSNMLPPPDAVRIEEMVNYFDYSYSPPTDDVPFASNVEVAACPWAPEHRLVRVGIKGREMDRTKRPKSNLVFLIDVSGSMDEPNKLPLVVEGMRMLTRELGENDRVAIVVYASTEGLVLESTRGDQQQTILDALGRLQAGGSTAGGAGIVLAYKIAEQNFIKGGVNRVILCTDGDFNVGVTSPAELQRMAEEKAKGTGVFLTVLGFGRGNLNDAMMEQVADHGNGNYHYVDNRTEARKVLVEEMAGTLVTIAKDVKIQIEFNPAKVAGYRLIGYENRVLAAEDFNDDKKDAGEIGAGHTVTALYEVIPVGQKVDAATVDDLKYSPVAPDGEAASAAADATDEPADSPATDELLTLKIRYKQPDGDESTKLEFPITDNGQAFAAASPDFQFASSVASFGMLLRGSKYKGDATFGGVLEIAESASRDRDPHGYRREFCDMIRQAKTLSGH